MVGIKKYPKITVVTPNYNQGDYIEETIKSVLNQNYPNLEYIIIDGGSTDDSVEIIKKYEKDLFFWSTEPDNGMYDAVNKGFLKSSGDIMCWINSDDILHEKSLYNVAELLVKNNKINWLQGFPNVINKHGDIIYEREHVFSKYFFYWYKHETSFSFVQQESTFWTRSLWEKVGANLNIDYTLAADFDLWMRFFEHEKMYCTSLKLGAFRNREGQKSSNKSLYIKETKLSINRNFSNLRLTDKFIIKLGYLLEKKQLPLTERLKNKFHSFFIGKTTNV